MVFGREGAPFKPRGTQFSFTSGRGWVLFSQSPRWPPRGPSVRLKLGKGKGITWRGWWSLTREDQARRWRRWQGVGQPSAGGQSWTLGRSLGMGLAAPPGAGSAGEAAEGARVGAGGGRAGPGGRRGEVCARLAAARGRPAQCRPRGDRAGGRSRAKGGRAT